MFEIFSRFGLALGILSSASLAAPVTNGANISTFAVHASGDGRPIIFIPGLSAPGAVWTQTIEHIGGRAQCHVLTLAGAAGQPAWPSEISRTPFLRAVEDELAAYITRNGLTRPVIVGHSIGGNIGLEFAERYPQLVGKLVVVDSLPFLAHVWFNVDSPLLAKPLAAATRFHINHQSREQYQKVVRSGEHTRNLVQSDGDFAKITEWGLEADQPTVAQAMYETLASDLRPGLGQISAPTLVVEVWNGIDGVTRQSVEEEFHAQYRGLKTARFAMAEKARHFVMLDEPQWFEAQLDGFLAEPD